MVAAPELTMAESQARLTRRATTAALGVALTLFSAKIVTWLMSGSVAMLASTLDSGLDIIATGFNYLAVRHALQPADHEHRFGHGKVEAIAGLAQGAFICGSALFLLFQSIEMFFRPEIISQPLAGIVVTLVTIIVTGVLVTYQRSVKRRTQSLAVTSDELHYRSDLILNIAVLIALILASPPFRLIYADPLMGLFIALYIAYSATTIVRQSYDQLMDREFSDAERDRIVAIVHKHPDVFAMHDLRTRQSGRDVFIQFHLELAPTLNLIEAHRISDEVETAVQSEFPGAEVLIHEDPAGYERPPGAGSVSAVEPPARQG